MLANLRFMYVNIYYNYNVIYKTNTGYFMFMILINGFKIISKASSVLKSRRNISKQQIQLTLRFEIIKDLESHDIYIYKINITTQCILL